MIEMHVSGIGTDESSGKAYVVLTDKNMLRSLPVVLGQSETEAVAAALQNAAGQPHPIPCLLSRIIQRFGYSVCEVGLKRENANACTARVRLSRTTANDDGNLPEIIIPADVYEAIALAIRTRLPVRVPEQLLSEGGMPADPVLEQEHINLFKQFVDTLRASDFKLPDTVVHPERNTA